MALLTEMPFAKQAIYLSYLHHSARVFRPIRIFKTVRCKKPKVCHVQASLTLDDHFFGTLLRHKSGPSCLKAG